LDLENELEKKFLMIKDAYGIGANTDVVRLLISLKWTEITKGPLDR